MDVAAMIVLKILAAPVMVALSLLAANAVLFRISRAFPNLAFNGFFTLVIR